MSDACWLVVSDLDGTLLDHDRYGFEQAEPALRRLRRERIPVILNTSKTRAELSSLRARLHNAEPYVVENGSAVFMPPSVRGRRPADVEPRGGEDCRVFGRPRGDILAALKPLRRRFRFEGFDDWDVPALMARTGLDATAAGAALAREFSEPLLWRDSAAALAAFRRELAALGLNTLQGGRFLHVQGACDKGQSLDRGQSIFCLNNVTDREQNINLADLNLIETKGWHDLISGMPINNLRGTIALAPYQSAWLASF